MMQEHFFAEDKQVVAEIAEPLVLQDDANPQNKPCIWEKEPYISWEEPYISVWINVAFIMSTIQQGISWLGGTSRTRRKSHEKEL